MYKVFIENCPVIFTQQSENYPHSLMVKASDLEDITDFIRNQVSIITDNQAVLIECAHVEDEFNRIFQNYDRAVTAGGVVSNGNDLLLIYKEGFWDLPKGFVDEDETLEACAYREIAEECGISGHVLTRKLIETMHTYVFQGRPILKKSHWFLFDYTGTSITSPQHEEGIIEAKWIAKNEVSWLFANCYGSIRDVLECYGITTEN